MVELLGEHSQTNPHEDFILCVTGDHTTPVRYGDHTSEPVPIAMGQVSLIHKALKEAALIQERDKEQSNSAEVTN